MEKQIKEQMKKQNNNKGKNHKSKWNKIGIDGAFRDKLYNLTIQKAKQILKNMYKEEYKQILKGLWEEEYLKQKTKFEEKSN